VARNPYQLMRERPPAGCGKNVLPDGGDRSLAGKLTPRSGPRSGVGCTALVGGQARRLYGSRPTDGTPPGVSGDRLAHWCCGGCDRGGPVSSCSSEIDPPAAAMGETIVECVRRRPRWVGGVSNIPTGGRGDRDDPRGCGAAAGIGGLNLNAPGGGRRQTRGSWWSCRFCCRRAPT
jgi:hypothetical protein